MKYFDFGTGPETREMYHDIVTGYVEQFGIARDSFPPELTEGEKFLAWLLIVNIHATCCIVEEPDEEEWKTK